MTSASITTKRLAILCFATVVAVALAALALTLSAGKAEASHLLASGRMWGYNASFQDSAMDVFDFSTDSQTGSFVPLSGNFNGRGVAFDPTDGALWVSAVIPPFEGDGFIHKVPADGGAEITKIDDGVPDPEGVGAMDYDPEDNALWVAAYDQSGRLYELDPADGSVLKSCNASAAFDGEGNDTLAIAHPADLGGQKVLLTDGGELDSRSLQAIDPGTCDPVKTYDIPVGVSGIDEDPVSGNLIVNDLYGNHAINLGKGPYDTIVSSTSFTPSNGHGIEDISLEARACTFSEILPPVNDVDSATDQGMSAYKFGSRGVVPAKFQVTCNGDPIDTQAEADANPMKLTLTKLGPTSAQDLVLEDTQTGSANTGDLFRFDDAADQYIYNIGIKGRDKGTYKITISDANGGGSHDEWFSIK